MTSGVELGLLSTRPMLCCRHIYIPFMQVVQLKFTHRKYIIYQNEYIISPIKSAFFAFQQK